MIIVCVLNTNLGNDRNYTPEHVLFLEEQCKKYAPQYEFVCLSNVKLSGITTEPLIQNYPGWWAKIELFRAFKEKTFYMDLDTVLIRDISPLVEYKHKFTALSSLSKKKSINSGIMCWDGDYSNLYHTFAKDPNKYMKIYVESDRWGDQGFINEHQKCDQFQKIFPYSIQSWKYELKRGDIKPHKDCKIVCFHGKPKPWEVDINNLKDEK
jgi:hypothetical protein